MRHNLSRVMHALRRRIFADDPVDLVRALALWRTDPDRAGRAMDRAVARLARGRDPAALTDLVLSVLPRFLDRPTLRAVLRLRASHDMAVRRAGHAALAAHALHCQDFRRAAGDLEALLSEPDALGPALRDSALVDLAQARFKLGDIAGALALARRRDTDAIGRVVQEARILAAEDPSAACALLNRHGADEGRAGKVGAAIELATCLARRDLDDAESLAGRIKERPGCGLLARTYLANIARIRTGGTECLKNVLAEMGLAVEMHGGAFDTIRLAPTGPVPTAGGPLVSVVMTAFNAEAHVETAIRSILSQTWGNLELLVVDDCSTDATGARIAAIGGDDARIRPLSTALNGGTYLAKNLGIAHARGDVVAFCDADDIWTPDHLSAHMALMTERPDVAMSSSNWLRIFEDGTIEIPPGGKIVERCPHSTMMRREVFERLGFFDSVRIGADREFFRRVTLEYGASATPRLARVLTLGRRRGGSLTTSGAGAIGAGATPEIRQIYRHTWTGWHLGEVAAGRPLWNSGRPEERPYPVPDAMV
ncbi:glycosyltransferase family A protein [Palleronia sp. LCG004]|uniref:glycosyltransferase family 2 protein n=1 Tax=Palleronia sp. LCG004 TaxID=3079304 RepID=UPI0029433A26|nr:glycosyltransferase family A protein [Palleronia sp. LCG004]WOI58448.1 glycosyltransferase family A protein [Palleronia sp. LCG004]